MKRFITITLVTVLLIFAAYTLTQINYDDNNTFTQLFPAWIQAVGSILAILYSSRFSMKQIQHEKDLERQKAAEADLSKLKSIKWLMVSAYNAAEEARNTVVRGSEEDYARAPSGLLREISKLFDKINPLDIPGGDLTLQVITVNSGLQGMADALDEYRRESHGETDAGDFKKLDNGSLEFHQICGDAMELVASEIKKLEKVIGKN